MFIFLYTVFRNSSISDEHVFCVALHFTIGHCKILLSIYDIPIVLTILVYRCLPNDTSKSKDIRQGISTKAIPSVKTSSYFSCCIKSLYNIPIFINNMCLSINLKTSHGVMGCWFMKRHIKCCYFNLNCTQRVRFFLSNFGSQYNS